MRKLFFLSILVIANISVFGLTIKVVGAGGIKADYNSNTGVTTLHICPQKADAYCATLKLDKGELEIITNGANNSGSGWSVNGNTQSYQLISAEIINEGEWSNVIIGINQNQ